MAPTNPAEFYGVNHLRDRFSQFREGRPIACVVEEWFLILDDEMIELEPELFVQQAHTIDVRRDFSDGSHGGKNKFRTNGVIRKLGELLENLCWARLA